MGRTVSEERVHAMQRMWAEGRTKQQIADECGVTLWAVKNYIWRHRDGFPKRSKFQRFSENVHYRMWEMYGDGASIDEMARAIGASRRTIYLWLRNDT